MIKKYSLEWLDTLIMQDLNNGEVAIDSISEHELSTIIKSITVESKKVQIRIKNEVFLLKKRREIRLAVRMYHSSFIFLMDKLQDSKEGSLQGSVRFRLNNALNICLEELLSFVENRFSDYLSLDQCAPFTYQLLARKEIRLRIDKLNEKQIKRPLDKDAMRIVFKNFDSVLQFKNGKKNTYRQLIYQKEVLTRIENLNWSSDRSTIYSVLDEVLFAYNFNALEYVFFMCGRMETALKLLTNLAERMNLLLLYYKEFNQLHFSEQLTFDPLEISIKKSIINWLEHEIDYLQKKIEINGDESIGKAALKPQVIKEKIQCTLSTDQMALILRAGDESRLLKARSMSQVFKTIVPYISTVYKKDLSYESVRSKSYNAEIRDKEIAVQALEKIIRLIYTY